MAVGPLAMVTFGMDLLGTVAGVAGGIEQAQADEETARMNSYLAIRNAKENAKKFRKRSRMEQGQAITDIGASGLAMSGSLKLALEDMMVTQELDALEIIRQGEMQAAGFGREAEAAKEGGRTALYSGIFGGTAKATRFAGTNLIEES